MSAEQPQKRRKRGLATQVTSPPQIGPGCVKELEKSERSANPAQTTSETNMITLIASG